MTDPEKQERLLESEPKTTPLPLPEGRPALTIHIHSWATPIIGLVMLLLGLVGGFYAYPLIEDRASAGPIVAAVPTAAVALQPTDAAAAAESQASLMEFVVSQTNHFIGDPDAPVTLIEFSDFQ